MVSKMWVATMMGLSASLSGGQAAMAQDQTAPAGPESAAQAPAGNAAQAAPSNPQVVAFVDSQFPSADADGNGTLTAAEFTAWISKLKAAELEKAGQADPAAVKTYADNALLTADTDKDGIVTKAELVKFFGG